MNNSILGLAMVLITVLSTLLASIFKRMASHKQSMSTIEKTMHLKAVKPQTFAMLNTDTQSYLRSVKVLSKLGHKR